MTFPRALNNTEKANLSVIKAIGYGYELKFNDSPYSGGYTANTPKLKVTWDLNSTITDRDIERVELAVNR